MSKKFDISIFVYGLALFSGISYLWGFWLNMDINILSYAELTDIVKASVYPALPAIGILAVYSAMDSYNSLSKKEYEQRIAIGGFSKGFAFFLKFSTWAVIATFLVYSAYTIFTESGYIRLRGLYPLISILLFLYIMHSNKFLMSLPVNLRVFVVSIFCFLPTVAFSKGYSDGEIAVDQNAPGFYVTSKGLCSSSDTEKFRYIAVLGNRLFTISSIDNSICITNSEDFRLLKYNEESLDK